jgi:DNA-binding transcriptional MerR regulator
MSDYFSTGEAARLLGVQPYRISYAHATGQVAEPIRVMGKRAYRWHDLISLGKHFNIELELPPNEAGKDKYGRV